MEGTTEKFRECAAAEHRLFSKKLEELIEKRFAKNKKKKAKKAFERLLMSELWMSHCLFFDGIELLDTLIDDECLAEAEELDRNFSGNIRSLLPDRIRENRCFQNSLSKLLAFSSKGVGKCELLLPLLIKGWKNEDSKDGSLRGKAVEIKSFSGGSMKPARSTKNGHIDELNDRLFGGHPPMNSKKGHEKHLAALEGIDAREAYLEYFSRILDKSKSEVERLADDLIENISDIEACRNIYGRHVLKAYREIDGFGIIMLIDPESGDMASIADFDDLPEEIAFSPKMTRRGDTQALADGYVNIKANKKKRRR